MELIARHQHMQTQAWTPLHPPLPATRHHHQPPATVPPPTPPTCVQQVEGGPHLRLAQLHPVLGAQAAELVQLQEAVIVEVVLRRR